GGIKDALEISIVTYEAQLGLRAKTAAFDLQKQIDELEPEDSYSPANLMLELGRQLTIRGRYVEAQQTLDHASRLIYASQNRRHEIILNLRYGYLLHQRGDGVAALNFVRSASRVLDPDVDRIFSLQVDGLENAIMTALERRS